MELTRERLPENMAEVLEAVWTLNEQGESTVNEVLREAATEASEKLLGEMCARNLIEIEPSRRVRLLEQGRVLAAQIIRRHRLAERLICDALGTTVEASELDACEFEHLVAEGITNSICTLLGHPRHCPHGRPIPEGDCCRSARDEVKAIVHPCTRLGMGQSARIAYLSTRDHSLLTKLTALGFAPGLRLKLLQRWPSFVVQCDENEIALEEEVAGSIYVWQSVQE